MELLILDPLVDLDRTNDVRAGLLDRLQITVAPLIIGDGRPGLRLPAPASLDQCPRPPARIFRMGADVLFDCDLRNPQINKYFGLERSPGFTDVMLGSVSLDEAVRSRADISLGEGDLFAGLAAEGLDRLHLLTSGTLPPHPSEILISAKFDELLDQQPQRLPDMILRGYQRLPTLVCRTKTPFSP